jgi:lipoate-protein ligase A
MTKKVWRFVDTAVSNGYLNMAIDETILNTHRQGSILPTLRVYRWSHPTVSIGHFQGIEDIDLKKCSNLGIDVVRRLTGGKAVLHHDELTYSVTVSESYGFSNSITESYRILCMGLIAAYQILGMKVCLTHRSKSFFPAACFAATSSADLTYKGHKIAGSAQVRRGNTLLQQGSLPINLNPKILLSILKASASMQDKALSKFGQKVTDLGESLGRHISWQDLRGALFKGFQEALNIKFWECNLTEEEVSQSRELARKKYSTIAWNHSR